MCFRLLNVFRKLTQLNAVDHLMHPLVATVLNTGITKELKEILNRKKKHLILSPTDIVSVFRLEALPSLVMEAVEEAV